MEFGADMCKLMSIYFALERSKNPGFGIGNPMKPE